MDTEPDALQTNLQERIYKMEKKNLDIIVDHIVSFCGLTFSFENREFFIISWVNVEL